MEDHEPKMIITRTPFRVSFVGGGTDLPEWYSRHPGAVLSATIDKYCYVTAQPLPPFYNYHSRLCWSELELVKEHKDFRHPAVRAALDLLQMNDGLAIHHEGELPARTGIGSSSAFCAGLLYALHRVRGDHMQVRGWPPEDLATETIYLERHVMGEAGGHQDQVAVAHGGLNRIDFHEGAYKVRNLRQHVAHWPQLERNLQLFYTGISRNSGQVQQALTERLLQADPDPALDAVMARAAEQVDDAELALASGEVEAFAPLLTESWGLKETMNPLAADAFSHVVFDTAREAGALGGKQTGAGGGGFLLLFVPPEKQADVRGAVRAAHDVFEVPFKFSWEGSKIVYSS